MDRNEISPGVYLSIHQVPYRVLSVRDDGIVNAVCEAGRSNSFEMPIDRFAVAMKCKR